MNLFFYSVQGWGAETQNYPLRILTSVCTGSTCTK